MLEIGVDILELLNSLVKKCINVFYIYQINYLQSNHLLKHSRDDWIIRTASLGSHDQFKNDEINEI